MLWWNKTVRDLNRRLKRKHSPQQEAPVETLEWRLPLGSVPTPTGTLAGELLPIETVELLSDSDGQALRQALQTARQGLTDDVKSPDLQLELLNRPAQKSIDQSFDELEQLRRDIAIEQAAVNRLLEEEAAVDSASDNDSDDSNSSGSVVETVPDNEVSSEAIEQALDLLDLDENLKDNSSLNHQPSDAATDDAGARTDAAAVESGDIGTQTATVENDPRNVSGDATNAVPSNDGSIEVTQAVNITFAATSGPSDPPKPTVAAAPNFGGGRNNVSPEDAGNFDVSQFLPQEEDFSQHVGSAWFNNLAQSVTVKYDFRDLNGIANEINPAEQQAAIAALQAWSQATNGQLQFVRDTQASDSEIVNIGKGSMTAFGYEPQPGGILAVGGGLAINDTETGPIVTGIAWLDGSEQWDSEIGNDDAPGTFDVFSVVAHEVSHSLGGKDHYSSKSPDILNGTYSGPRDVAAIDLALAHHDFNAMSLEVATEQGGYDVHPITTGFPQLVGSEVQQLLNFATAVTPSRDAIIAIVDRGGNILGVRIEDGVAPLIKNNVATRTFAIDGAVAKARTAAFFANNGADLPPPPVPLPNGVKAGTGTPLTSRTIRYISQTAISFREVNSNPNATSGTVRGPGFVAPIGTGGHFPPAISFTPPVDLFAIEHTNRDGIEHPGADGDKRQAADNIKLPSRFNVGLNNVQFDGNNDNVVDTPYDANNDGVRDATYDSDNDGVPDKPVPTQFEINAPESYGTQSGLFPKAQARGIATLPGGIPLYRDTNNDGVGDFLVGGVGVFFPGPDGTADFEQGFVAGVGQTEAQRLNAPKVLEAELIAVAVGRGSRTALRLGVAGAVIEENPIPTLDIPFGRLTLVGIQLEVIGPRPGLPGVRDVLALRRRLGSGTLNGMDQVVKPGGVFYADGQSVPSGWLVKAHGSSIPGGLTAADVEQIVNNGIAEAARVRAAIRLPVGSRTKMVFAVSDTNGEVLGVFRMDDATFFSIDVAVAKSRNTAYYADSTAIQNIDRVRQNSSSPTSLTPAGTAFTNRTFRFLAEPRFPSGADGSPPGQFSQLHDLARATGIPANSVSNVTRLIESTAPINISNFKNNQASVTGHDAFMVGTNFRDPSNLANQNGIVFFPGSGSLYKNGVLVGGFGVSGDGVDQDDVVTSAGLNGYVPPANVQTADQIIVDGVRLPYIKFLRNPYG